jgi:hypothetical protein
MSTLGRVVALVAVTLVIGATLCVFDADDATGPDLCGLLLLPVVGLAVMDPRLLVGRLVPVLIPIHLADPLDRPVPPPRA